MKKKNENKEIKFNESSSSSSNKPENLNKKSNKKKIESKKILASEKITKKQREDLIWDTAFSIFDSCCFGVPLDDHSFAIGRPTRNVNDIIENTKETIYKYCLLNEDGMNNYFLSLIYPNMCYHFPTLPKFGLKPGDPKPSEKTVEDSWDYFYDIHKCFVSQVMTLRNELVEYERDGDFSKLDKVYFLKNRGIAP